MANVHVEKQTDIYLRLIKEPSFLFKAITIGFLPVAVYINVFGSGIPLIKILIGLAVIGLSYLFIGKYEVWEFDKVKCELKFTRITWFHYLLDRIGYKCKHPRLRTNFNELDVEEKEASNSGNTCFRIVSSKLKVELEIEEPIALDNPWSEPANGTSIRSFLSDLFSVQDDSMSEDDFEQVSAGDIEELKTHEECEKVSSAPLPMFVLLDAPKESIQVSASCH